MNRPLDRALEIIDDEGKAIWSANVEEVGDPLDPEAAANAESVPAFHGLSRGGDVRGQLVYANFGKKEDYDALVEAGQSMPWCCV
jgi:N-acetylated-alpha-linked acidic dipeptidase